MVLVHGIGSSGAYFRRLVPELAGRWRVLAPDLPGHGRSPRPPRPHRARGRRGGLLRPVPTLADHADALHALLEAEGARGAVVVGHSMGSQVAVELAVRHPGAASRLVLVTPTVDASARSVLVQVGCMLRSLVREPPSVLPVQVASVLACGPLAYLRTIGPVLAHRVEDRLPGVGVPVTVVHGQSDPLCSAEWSAHLAAAAPRGRLVVVPGCHVLQWSHPAQLAAAVDGEPA
ncbi:alpha/beta fold hydrolase [Quadrisphaera sp. KR29]|uniref:alpha/beta fold hydrolase n=1 Tax=Quadrisphaera sp. KR29 TaxID=3461391 RepID=UPI0040440387